MQRFLLFVLFLSSVAGLTNVMCDQGKENLTIATSQTWCCGPKGPQVSFQVQALFQSLAIHQTSAYSFFIGYGYKDCNETSWDIIWQGMYNASDAKNHSVYVIIPLPQPHHEFSVVYGYKNMNDRGLRPLEILQWYVLVDLDGWS